MEKLSRAMGETCRKMVLCHKSHQQATIISLSRPDCFLRQGYYGSHAERTKLDYVFVSLMKLVHRNSRIIGVVSGLLCSMELVKSICTIRVQFYLSHSVKLVLNIIYSE
jgi:hypothetical protein